MDTTLPKPRRRSPRRSRLKDGAVVDYAVHQQDRRPGRLDVAGHESALHGWQLLNAVSMPLVAVRAAQQPERVERDMGACPDQLDGGAGHAGRRQQGPGGATQDVRGPLGGGQHRVPSALKGTAAVGLQARKSPGLVSRFLYA